MKCNFFNRNWTPIWLPVLFLFSNCWGFSFGVNLYALFNMDGIEGTINFIQATEASNVTVVVNINSLKEPGNYSWYIASNLISYSERNPCAKKSVGNRIEDLTPRHGQLSVPTSGELVLTDSEIMLHGVRTIWEKSIVLEGPNTVCTNILNLDPVRHLEARFTSTVGGTVTFRQSFVNASVTPNTIITADLFHVASDSPTSSNHEWKILVTDILDSKPTRRAGTCDHLTLLYDPDNIEDVNCTGQAHSFCKKGDLTRKHGPITIGGKQSRFSRKIVFDTNLPFPNLNGPRFLYVAIYTADSPNTIFSCAKIGEVLSKESQVRFLSGGVRGYVSFRQQSPLDPTHVTVNLTNLNDTAVFYHIHLFPVPPKLKPDDDVCSTVSDHYNPLNVDLQLSPAPGNGTFDKYQIGDLSGKYGLLHGDRFVGEYIDPYMTLYGQLSIVGRSIVVHKEDSSRWICANIEYPRPVVTAIATFYYPFAGRVIFRQDEENPLDDTSVFIESLMYDDGTKNFSTHHQWYIHTYQASNDSLDWKQRCVSAGPAFNSYGVNTGANGYQACSSANPLRCIVGDLTKKFGRISIATAMTEINRTRLFYTDVNLPVTGQSGIIGRSVVVQDDNAPDFRGKQLGCGSIYRRYPSRARVSEWSSSGSSAEIIGHVTMEQYTEYDLTSTSLEVRGLQDLASGYHVHEVSVPLEFHFPCTNDAVYGHYNPFHINPKLSPAPGTGTSDQYELGDLSGKYGTLEDIDSVYIEGVDSNLPVQGPYSVMGRSVVIHRKERNERWVCGNVEPYVKENARRIQAVASFHHPKAFAYGYIRFGQQEYADGSLSDTTIEISIRHPGIHNKNLTRGHQWAVFVSQVGEDAAVASQMSRCLGAGYRWNPFRVKSNSDDYGSQCNAHNQFSCEMGDLSGRHGPIDVGGRRIVFTDSNLPLAGNFTVMKKSVVIFEKNGENSRFACANILPDNDITQKVQIKKLNRITDQAFINKAREVMAVPDWMMYIIAGETKDIGNCLQLTLFFRGPDANRLQLDFDKLLNTGSVDKQYAVALGDVMKKRPEFPYRACTTILDTLLNSQRRYVSVPSVVMLTSILAIFSSQLL